MTLTFQKVIKRAVLTGVDGKLYWRAELACGHTAYREIPAEYREGIPLRKTFHERCTKGCPTKKREVMLLSARQILELTDDEAEKMRPWPGR